MMITLSLKTELVTLDLRRLIGLALADCGYVCRQLLSVCLGLISHDFQHFLYQAVFNHQRASRFHHGASLVPICGTPHHIFL